MLTIADRPGVIPAEKIRECFERLVNETPSLSVGTPLGAMRINGRFSHYMDADTDTLFLGFALGMRCHERMSKEPLTESESDGKD